MKNRHLVIPRYRLVKECRDALGRVTWQRVWYYREEHLYDAYQVFTKAVHYWVPDNPGACVLLYDGNRVLVSYGFGEPLAPCGVAPCGANCSICPIGGGAF